MWPKCFIIFNHMTSCFCYSRFQSNQFFKLFIFSQRNLTFILHGTCVSKWEENLNCQEKPVCLWSLSVHSTLLVVQSEIQMNKLTNQNFPSVSGQTIGRGEYSTHCTPKLSNWVVSICFSICLQKSWRRKVSGIFLGLGSSVYTRLQMHVRARFSLNIEGCVTQDKCKVWNNDYLNAESLGYFNIENVRSTTRKDSKQRKLSWKIKTKNNLWTQVVHNGVDVLFHYIFTYQILKCLLFIIIINIMH
jgi:hypothetical protein